MKRAKWTWSRSAVAVGFGALAVGALASVGAAVSPKRTAGATTQYQPHKVMICHHTHSTKNPSVTIIVSQRALPAHMRHGDTVGPCAAVETTQQQAAKTRAPRGKSKGHAKKQTLAPAVTPAIAVAPANGKSGTAPGHTGAAPGHAKSPAHRGTPPGHAPAPAPPTSPPAEVATPTPPAPSTTPPGHGGTPPGHGGTPPGHGGTPPGQASTPPGQAGTPPGQSDKEPKK
jgi:hypothetical protein